jgi:RNA polymerase sigma factor for flagellar operon FliA
MAPVREPPAPRAWPEVQAAVARAAHWMTRGAGARVAYEDLVGVGHEALVLAEREYDDARGVPFEAYARLRIRRAMIDEVRREGRLAPRTRAAIHAAEVADGVFETLANDDEHRGNPQVWGSSSAASATLALVHAVDFGGDPSERFERAQLKARAQAIVNGRPHPVPRLFAIVYDEGRTLVEAARELGLSAPWVCRIHAREIAHLARELGAAAAPRANPEA